MSDKSLSSRRYYFNSINRNANSLSSANFNIALTNQIDPRYNAMIVHKVSMPYTYYTINNTNNNIYFQDGVSGILTATITEGNYTANSLASAIGTALTASSSVPLTYTVTVSSVTNKFTIAATGSFSLFPATQTANAIWRTIGFNGPNQISNTTFTAPNSYNLQPTNMVYIESNLAPSTAYTSAGERSIILSFPINGNFGEIITYEPYSRNPIPLNNVGSYLTFILLDDNFNVIDLNGVNWSIEVDFLAY